MEYAKALIDSGKYKNYEISEKLGICDPTISPSFSDP